MSDRDVPNEMSSVLRVRHAFTTCGMKERVVHMAAASPRAVVSITCHTLKLRPRIGQYGEATAQRRHVIEIRPETIPADRS
jgi:hypothetical protein